MCVCVCVWCEGRFEGGGGSDGAGEIEDQYRHVIIISGISVLLPNVLNIVVDFLSLIGPGNILYVIG